MSKNNKKYSRSQKQAEFKEEINYSLASSQEETKEKTKDTDDMKESANHTYTVRLHNFFPPAYKKLMDQCLNLSSKHNGGSPSGS